jgi:hypothetical protein
LAAIVPDAPSFDGVSRSEANRERGFIRELNEHFGAIAVIIVDGAAANNFTSQFCALNHVFPFATAPQYRRAEMATISIYTNCWRMIRQSTNEEYHTHRVSTHSGQAPSIGGWPNLPPRQSLEQQ